MNPSAEPDNNTNSSKPCITATEGETEEESTVCDFTTIDDETSDGLEDAMSIATLAGTGAGAGPNENGPRQEKALASATTAFSTKSKSPTTAASNGLELHNIYGNGIQAASQVSPKCRS
jgi:hypothetical protein